MTTSTDMPWWRLERWFTSLRSQYMIMAFLPFSFFAILLLFLIIGFLSSSQTAFYTIVITSIVVGVFWFYAFFYWLARGSQIRNWVYLFLATLAYSILWWFLYNITGYSLILWPIVVFLNWKYIRNLFTRFWKIISISIYYFIGMVCLQLAIVLFPIWLLAQGLAYHNGYTGLLLGIMVALFIASLVSFGGSLYQYITTYRRYYKRNTALPQFWALFVFVPMFLNLCLSSLATPIPAVERFLDSQWDNILDCDTQAEGE